MKAATKSRRKRKRSPGRTRERAFFSDGIQVAGVDEVGRGAWAGPLVAAAVVLDPAYKLRGARDSKDMTHEERVVSARCIHETSLGVGIGVVEIEELNEFGLSWAIKESGIRAVKLLPNRPRQILLDGNWNYFRSRYRCETIVDGDAKELCIAAASVVAKVHRDEIMRQLHELHPEYGFAENKGYGTAVHRKALKELGPCAIHRMTYQPVVLANQAELPMELAAEPLA